MRLLAAPDKFRGSATAADAADAMARACDLVGWRCTRLPMADGGEGTLEVFGGANRESIVTGPLGNPVPGRVAQAGRHRHRRDGPRRGSAAGRGRIGQRPDACDLARSR